MADIKSPEELIQFFNDYPHIEELHFDAQGNHYLQAHRNANGENVTHIDPLGQSKTLIVHSVTREQALEDAELAEKVLQAIAAKDAVVEEEEIVTSEEIKDVQEGADHDDLIPQDGAMTE